MGHPDIGQAGDELARPVVLAWGQHFENRLQVIENRQNEPTAGPEERLQRASLGGLEQFGKMAVSRKETREGNAKDGVGWVAFAAS